MEFTLLEFGIVGAEEGCEVHVVGDHPALGCWSPAQSVPLHPSGTMEGLPFWKTRTPISVPSGTTIQYKYLLMKDGLLHRWENFEGNRESADVQGPSTEAGLTRLPTVTAAPHAPTRLLRARGRGNSPRSAARAAQKPQEAVCMRCLRAPSGGEFEPEPEPRTRP